MNEINPYSAPSIDPDLGEGARVKPPDPDVGCFTILVAGLLCSIGLVYLISAVTMLGHVVMFIQDESQSPMNVLSRLAVLFVVGILFCASGVLLRHRRYVTGIVAACTAVGIPITVAWFA